VIVGDRRAWHPGDRPGAWGPGIRRPGRRLAL